MKKLLFVRLRAVLHHTNLDFSKAPPTFSLHIWRIATSAICILRQTHSTGSCFAAVRLLRNLHPGKTQRLIVGWWEKKASVICHLIGGFFLFHLSTMNCLQYCNWRLIDQLKTINGSASTLHVEYRISNSYHLVDTKLIGSKILFLIDWPLH